MKSHVKCVLLFLSAVAIGVSNSLIVPEDFSSLLQVVYANFPPIRKGFDTRFGFGFRFGPHADVQLVTEIGPQIETQRLMEPASQRRRHAHQLTDYTPSPPSEVTSDESSPQPDSWLAKWHRSVTQREVNEKVKVTQVKDSIVERA